RTGSEFEHHHRSIARARRGYVLAARGGGGPAPPDDRAGVLERLSAAAIGYRRLSGALVRGLSRPQPLHGVRPLSALWRELRLLDQHRGPVAGDAVAVAA